MGNNTAPKNIKKWINMINFWHHFCTRPSLSFSTLCTNEYKYGKKYQVPINPFLLNVSLPTNLFPPILSDYSHLNLNICHQSGFHSINSRLNLSFAILSRANLEQKCSEMLQRISQDNGTLHSIQANRIWMEDLPSNLGKSMRKTFLQIQHFSIYLRALSSLLPQLLFARKFIIFA